MVVAASGGDRSHPLFEYIFIAPLAAWVIAIVLERLIARRRKGRAP